MVRALFHVEYFPSAHCIRSLHFFLLESEKLIESIVFLFFCFLPPYCLLYSIHCVLGVQPEITGSVQATSGVKVLQFNYTEELLY